MREKLNIRQIDLAIRVGVGSNTISQYEHGKRTPNVMMLKKLAHVLNCSVDELLEDTN